MSTKMGSRPRYKALAKQGSSAASSVLARSTHPAVRRAFFEEWVIEGQQEILERVAVLRAGHPDARDEDIEDITQDAIVRAYKWLIRQPFLDKNASFTTFVKKIATNLVFDSFRKPKEHVSIEDWNETDADTGEQDERAFGELAKMEDRLTLDRWLSLLSAKDRELIHLRFWEGCDFAEIGERLGKPEGTVKVATWRALDRLRDAIDPEELTGW